MSDNPFAEWLRLQRQLQIEAFDLDPAQLEGDARAEFMRWNSWALVSELVEAMDETGWKPWATSRHMNREAFIKEMVDLMHFVGNLILCAANTYEGEFVLRDGSTSNQMVDITGLADELWEAYKAKHEVNKQRQVDGYDGVSDKCPICKRELIHDMIKVPTLEDTLRRPESEWPTIPGDVHCPVHGSVL